MIKKSRAEFMSKGKRRCLAVLFANAAYMRGVNASDQSRHVERACHPGKESLFGWCPDSLAGVLSML